MSIYALLYVHCLSPFLLIILHYSVKNSYLVTLSVWSRQILDLGWQCSFGNQPLHSILLNHYICPFPVNGGHLFDNIFSFGKYNCHKFSILYRLWVKCKKRNIADLKLESTPPPPTRPPDSAPVTSPGVNPAGGRRGKLCRVDIRLKGFEMLWNQMFNTYSSSRKLLYFHVEVMELDKMYWI